MIIRLGRNIKDGAEEGKEEKNDSNSNVANLRKKIDIFL